MTPSSDTWLPVQAPSCLSAPCPHTDSLISGAPLFLTPSQAYPVGDI